MQLPKIFSENVDFNLLVSKWSAILNPLIASPSNNVILLENISLINGTNVINHMLGRVQQGWRIADINGAATIYRSSAFNNLTLTLHSSAAVTVAIEVF